MLKRVMRLFVNDSPDGRSHRVRDGLLSAVPVGKVLVAGTLWTGSLKPLIDAIAATFGPSLDTPLGAGRTLHAEQLAGVIDLGRTWTGSLLSEIRSAAASSSATGPTVDTTEVLGAVEKLRAEMHADPVDFPGVADALRRVRRAADKVGGARTGDAAGSTVAKGLVAVTPASIKFMEGLNRQARELGARGYFGNATRSPPQATPRVRTGDAGGALRAKQLIAITPESIKYIEGLNQRARDLAASGFFTGT